jgi:hypothetical protein
LDAHNHFGESGGELGAATHARDLAFTRRVVGCDHAIPEALAILIEGSVFVGAGFHAFEIRVRDADQFRARTALRRRERLMEDRFVHQILRLGKDAGSRFDRLPLGIGKI